MKVVLLAGLMWLLDEFKWLFLIGGIFALSAAITDWDWFFNGKRAAVFVKSFGRKGARTFYAIVGVLYISIYFYLIWQVMA